MAVLCIEGGTPLQGEITVNGAKNAVLPLMAAALLTTEPVVLQGVPQLKDVASMANVLASLGVQVLDEAGTLTIQAAVIAEGEVPDQQVRQLRASNLLLGPVLGRGVPVKIALPGGCDIGSRPMDLHLRGLREMGIEVEETGGFIWARGKPRGGSIQLDFPSVGATENLIMAAALAEGETCLYNAAREPEIQDLQNFLNCMGARVRGAGTDTVVIDGVSRLGGTVYRVLPDRIAAGTHLLAGAITRGQVVVRGVVPLHLQPLLAKLRQAGAGVQVYKDAVSVNVERWLTAVDCKTMPYPGYPTDLQPQLMALLTTCQGTGVVSETIFENRFKHVPELVRMGASIQVVGRVAVVKGKRKLCGAKVEAHDLRAAAALVLAGLVAEGQTNVGGLEHLDRGYQQLEHTYIELGAQIKRLPN